KDRRTSPIGSTPVVRSVSAVIRDKSTVGTKGCCRSHTSTLVVDRPRHFIPMRLRSSHLAIALTAALLLFAVSFLVYTNRQANGLCDPRPLAESGKERCMRKCAGIQKGYVYRGAQRGSGAVSRAAEPEFCTCVGHPG